MLQIHMLHVLTAVFYLMNHRTLFLLRYVNLRSLTLWRPLGFGEFRKKNA